MKICIDAGHYGKYNRSKVVPSYYESEMNWMLQNLLASALEAYGVTIVKTRADQTKDLGLSARGKKAKGCDLFLSLHSNACDTESVDYPLVVTMQDGKGDALGKKIAAKIAELMDTTQAGKITKKRGTYGGEWYGVLNGADTVGTMGLIIEHSFHTNKKAATWLSSDANLQAMAAAEAAIIAEHFGLVKQAVQDKPTAPAPGKALGLGDVVTFTGSKHYKSSGARTGTNCKPGRAEITAMAPGKAHPYHLVRIDKTGPYGWVNAADISETAPAATWEPKEGDMVYFNGGKHYGSSSAAKGSTAAAGTAKITRYVKGKAHPYHLVRTGKTGPYGWVDAGSFKKA